jgi:hypothetical protein
VSLHITEDEWSMAEQAHDEVRARAIAEGRRYTRNELALRIGEIRREARDARRWRIRALAAEAKLAALACPEQKEGQHGNGS